MPAGLESLVSALSATTRPERHLEVFDTVALPWRMLAGLLAPVRSPLITGAMPRWFSAQQGIHPEL